MALKPKIIRGKKLSLAIAQLPITGDARRNGAEVRRAMREAAASGARLVQFPEGMLSGYAKNPIMDWSEVDWRVVRQELEAVMSEAAELKIWVVLGSAHPLSPPHRPHNSLYIVSDEGRLITRYDKRIVSYTEVTHFYTPGCEPTVFEVDGFRFGCIICVEINFSQLFIEYDQLGIDCLLLSAYPIDTIFYIKARAYAAIHNYWISLATPADTSHLMMSGLIGPHGETLSQLATERGIVFGQLDLEAPELDIPLNKARPWRASIATNPAYQTRHLDDPRSVDRTCV